MSCSLLRFNTSRYGGLDGLRRSPSSPSVRPGMQETVSDGSTASALRHRWRGLHRALFAFRGRILLVAFFTLRMSHRRCALVDAALGQRGQLLSAAFSSSRISSSKPADLSWPIAFAHATSVPYAAIS